MNEQELFECPECGLHYRDEKNAKECEEFCKANKACSIEITKNSVEYESNQS
jgi:hypothetical protein